MEPAAEARIKTLILEAEKANQAARKEIERARRAGIDVSAMLKELADLDRRISRMKAVYIEGK